MLISHQYLKIKNSNGCDVSYGRKTIKRKKVNTFICLQMCVCVCVCVYNIVFSQMSLSCPFLSMTLIGRLKCDCITRKNLPCILST